MIINNSCNKIVISTVQCKHVLLLGLGYAVHPDKSGSKQEIVKLAYLQAVDSGQLNIFFLHILFF